MKSLCRALVALSLLVLLGSTLFQPSHLLVAQTPTPTPTPQPVEIKIRPEVFDAYIGQYQDAGDAEFIFSFFREGDKFYGQATDQV